MDTNISEATCSLSTEVMDKLSAMTNEELSEYLKQHISCDSPELLLELSVRYFGLLNKWNQHHDPIE